MKRIFLLSCLCFPCLVRAEIVLDGSLGQTLTLSAPDYQIDATLGQQVGGNLFHSFQKFNLNMGESATFTGDETIARVISRVTGGEASFLDGTLRSTIPHADFYFINPQGIIFGQHARLDIQGSAYFSSAERLVFADGLVFEAQATATPLLSSAPISAFGFLNSHPAGISVNQGQLVVPTGEQLALVGGEIRIRGESFYLSTEETGHVPEISKSAVLQAPEGRIDLVSVDSAGEVLFSSEGINTSTIRTFAPTRLENAYVDVSGMGGGHIFIRAGILQLQQSHLRSYSRNQTGGLVRLSADSIEFDGSELFTHTFGQGNATDIILEAQTQIWLHGHNLQGEEQRASSIAAYTYSKEANGGQSSDISLQAQQIIFEEGGHFIGSVEGTGGGGFVTFRAGELILFQGESLSRWRAGITVDNVSRTSNSGDANSVLLEAKEIVFKDGAGIEGGTRGVGDLGNYTIHASDRLELSGVQASNGTGSRILARVLGGSLGGGGGTISIEAGDIVLDDGAIILATTTGKGNGGNIIIKVDNTLALQGTTANGSGSGIIANSEGARNIKNIGKGGTIVIEAKELRMQEGAIISSNSLGTVASSANDAGEIYITVTGDMILQGVNPYGETEEGFGTGIYARSFTQQQETGVVGKAGKIRISATRLMLKDGALLSSSTNSNQAGGDIEVHAQVLLIQGDSSQITLQSPNSNQQDFAEDIARPPLTLSQSGIYARTESPFSNAGQGGTIHLFIDNLVLKGNANISTASTGDGQAGSIDIQAQSMTLQDNSHVTTEAVNAGGGDIYLQVSDILHLQDCQLNTRVQNGTGDGGNITITAPQFIILDNSQIITQAIAGNGGNIYLSTQEFIAGESLVDASSELGIDGEILISSPAKNLTGSLIILSANFADASVLIKDNCKVVKDVKELSRFTHKMERDGVPKAPEHWFE
ncbi:filamentous hemagglutinin family N-terminal domain [Beggiatoa alba B18LD]|uniref:Filamentous hemagglutinin family N-terminal domain n=1 Tax=Beggiatoa alba B18LD TaxID=395493 RepID=I3CBS7_9GAMM|nr:filamentous hemagglutinin N-terminal domain-containing protein [Beggiatoa alba]EIJ41070.1 filamentous hemagglutinin family N-terminal domain [Beggiatoa alba B18LD]